MHTNNNEGKADPQVRLLQLLAGLELPVIAAPMFLVSGPDLLIANCKAGIIGSLPSPNARTIEQLDEWLGRVTDELATESANGKQVAPWLFNMIVHSSYDRFDAEMDLVRQYRPALVSTALGSPRRVIDEVHAYGGVVLADVTSPTMAKKAVAAGVDAIILVCNGAGGHTGAYNPFAFAAEVRQFWKGPLGMAGAIGSGSQIHAAQILGCDFAVVGTRLIAASESMVSAEYRQMLIDCSMEDLVPTKVVSGVLANWMKPSLDQAGIDPDIDRGAQVDFSGNIATANKAWKHVWSAGHGVGAIARISSASDIVTELSREYFDSLGKSG